MQITVSETQIREIQAMLAEIGKEATPLLVRSLNKTAAKAKTRTSQEIRKQVRLTASYVREKLEGPDDSPFNRAYPTKLAARISAPTRGLLLSYFATTVIGETPIKLKIKPSGSAKTLEGKPEMSPPFWLVLRYSGVWGIAQRRKTPGSKGGMIEVLHGPSLSQVFTDVKEDVAPEMNTFLAEKIDAEVNYLLARFRNG